MAYKKNDIVLLQDGNSTRKATVTKDGIDSQGKVRVRPSGFPMDISVNTKQEGAVYIIQS